MKAIIYRQYGGPEVLEHAEVPAPKLSQNGVLIRVKAAALNPADHKLQAGLGDSIMDAWLPVIPRWDVAGVVERAGAGLTEFAEGDGGDRLCARRIQPGPQTEECELGTGCGACRWLAGLPLAMVRLRTDS